MAAIPSPVKNGAGTGILQSTLSPKYLHTNSTSHTWPFSAIAELIDNAYDPDVKASQLWINRLQLRGKICLSFIDNGNGMTPEKLHKMLSFGFCEKVEDKGHMPVGHYGNGFKSGSMRLGKDALVLTKQETSRSIGFLSQTYLEATKAETVLVPIATWDTTPDLVVRANQGTALDDIMKYSLLHSQEEIMEQFDRIISPHGTLIIISNIRKTVEKQSEFDFVTDEYDIRIPDDANTEGGKYRQTKRQNHIPECDYSLKAYCAILYLKPKMQIILRGKKVKTLVVEKSLSQTEVDRYKPQACIEPVKVVFGFNSRNKNHYGIMMYHRNRLIKPYERVGHQLKANNLGVGVVGVVQCDFLQPTHNKQDFDYTKTYRACISSLGTKLNEYWNEKKGHSRSVVNNNNSLQPLSEPPELKALPDQNWVQCDKPTCLKWRKLPDGVNPDSLPDKWYCHMNPDVNYKSCDIQEERDDEPAIIQPYAKVQKKRLEKELHEKARREKEAQVILQVKQEMKKRELQEKEVALRQKEAILNEQLAVLQDTKPKIKVEGALKIPTAQVLPRPTMVKVNRPLNAVHPTANQSPARLVQNNQSTRSPPKPNQSTPRPNIVSQSTPRQMVGGQLTPRPNVVSQSMPRPMVHGQSTPRPIVGGQSTPRPIVGGQSTPRPIVGGQSTPRPIVGGQSIPRSIVGNQSKPLVRLSSQQTPMSANCSPGTQLIKAKTMQSAPPAIRLITKAVPCQLDSSRLTFKVMKSSNGNAFLVQEKTPIQAAAKKSLVPSSPKDVKPCATTLFAASKVALSLSPGNTPNPKTPGVDGNPARFSLVLPKPQAVMLSPTMARDSSAVNDRFCKIVPNTQQSSPSVQSPTKTVDKGSLLNAITQVQTTAAIAATSFPQLVSAISTVVTSLRDDKRGILAGMKREHSDNIISSIPIKTPKRVEAVIVIDPLPPAETQTTIKKTNIEARINELEVELKENTNKLQLQLKEKDNLLNRMTNELKETSRELLDKSSALNDKTRQLNCLRSNVCKLLQVLVPEIDVNREAGQGEGNAVDELLRQVLEANQ